MTHDQRSIEQCPKLQSRLAEMDALELGGMLEQRQ